MTRRLRIQVVSGLALAVLRASMAGAPASAGDIAAVLQERAAIERVYHNHRTGAKLSFEEATPPATLENLVLLDRKKEWVLEHAYGTVITPALLEAEVRRIDTTTRA